MGETRVDLQHLLEDLRDAYTGEPEETILTEVVANALDSGAKRIELRTDPTDATLMIVDDGRGMRRRELARYHDVAASTKTRGESIGFAGIGIKLGLLIAREVVTEATRGATHVATRWHLASRHRAPWKWIPPPGMTPSRGTAVRLTLTNPLSPLLDAGYLEGTVRRHFEALFDPTFDEVLKPHYPARIQFVVDGRLLTPVDRPHVEHAPVAIRVGRRRRPAAVGYIERRSFGGPEADDGIAISTLGKVIKRGWDWLGLAPVARSHLSGLIEAPELAACLTLSKNDFIRSGTRGAAYLAYRKAIQEVVSRQLAAWGDDRTADARPRMARLERDLERVLEDLAHDFPLLRSLVERRAGGQNRLPMPGRGRERVPVSLFAAAAVGHASSGASSPESETGAAGRPQGAAAPPSEQAPAPPSSGLTNGDDPPDADRTLGDEPHAAGELSAGADTMQTAAGRRRPARYGLLVQFESRLEDPELGRLVDSTIWINDAHPAFVRAAASRSLGYHTALVVAFTLAPLAVDVRDEHAFILQFLAHWGGSRASQTSRGRASRKEG